jgi:hypothetical protein
MTLRPLPLRTLAGVPFFVSLLLPSCTNLTPAVNTNGTPTNAAQQVAGVALGAYLAADEAYLAYVTSGHATKAVEAQIDPLRADARTKLHAFVVAANSGTAAAEQTVFNIAEQALESALSHNGIKVGSN